MTLAITDEYAPEKFDTFQNTDDAVAVFFLVWVHTIHNKKP